MDVSVRLQFFQQAMKRDTPTKQGDMGIQHTCCLVSFRFPATFAVSFWFSVGTPGHPGLKPSKSSATPLESQQLPW